MTLIWSADNNQNKFIPLDSNKLEWVEKINNHTMFFFTFVKYYEKENGLLLYDEQRDLHVFIHNNQLKVGYALDDLRLLYTGRWINFDEKKSLVEHFRKAEIEQRNHFLLFNKKQSNSEETKCEFVLSKRNNHQNGKILDTDIDDFMVDVLERARFDPNEEYLTIFSDSPLSTDTDDTDFESDYQEDNFINRSQNNHGIIFI
jgi:hypothetical protein